MFKQYWDGTLWEVKNEQSVSSDYTLLGICFSTHWCWTAIVNERFWAIWVKTERVTIGKKSNILAFWGRLLHVFDWKWLIAFYIYTRSVQHIGNFRDYVVKKVMEIPGGRVMVVQNIGYCMGSGHFGLNSTGTVSCLELPRVGMHILLFNSRV